MTQTDAYPLNESQLELVFNFPYYGALYMFKEPLTPSEAARRLQVPANVMHYRVKRLHEASLLEVADDSSRSRTYKTVAQTFAIAPHVLPAVTDALPSMLDGMLSKLHRNFLGRVEADLGDLEALLEDGPIVFELNESLILGTINPHEYSVWVSLATRSLSTTQYQKIVGAVSAILDEVEVDKGEKRWYLGVSGLSGRWGDVGGLSPFRGCGRLASGGRLRDFSGWRQCGIPLARGGPGRRDRYAGGAG